MNLSSKILNHIQTAQGDFNQLALEAFQYQFENCVPYKNYCQQLNFTPTTIQHWQQIPAVSTDIFREFDLCTFDAKTANYCFTTSGTTQEVKGKHYYRDLTLYNAAIQNNFLTGLNLSATQSLRFRILTPSFKQHPESSLFYMMQQIINFYGDADSKFYYKNNDIDYAELAKDLTNDVANNHRVILLGTAFSFINFFDCFPNKSWQLAAGSKLMETGGLKGRSRQVSRAQLYELFSAQFHLDLNQCYSEYSMTELSSQCYSNPNSHIFNAPHWMPVRIINPETGNEVAIGEVGLVQFFDLANLEAVSAILTFDLAIRHAQGFELVGRAPRTVLRGCSNIFEKDVL